MTKPRQLVFLLSMACISACGGADSAPASPGGSASKPAAVAVDPTSEKEARELFQTLCATCHGTTGHGDGPGSVAINPKPRSFADEEWQASVTDEHIQKVIVYGGAAVGKSPFMVGQPQLKGKTGVLDALTKLIRAYRIKR